MTRNERYRKDPEYRAKINAANRASYHRRMQDPLYAKIHLTRCRIHNSRAAIQHHEERLAFFHSRIERDLRLLRKLLAQRDRL